MIQSKHLKFALVASTMLTVIVVLIVSFTLTSSKEIGYYRDPNLDLKLVHVVSSLTEADLI